MRSGEGFSFKDGEGFSLKDRRTIYRATQEDGEKKGKRGKISDVSHSDVN